MVYEQRLLSIREVSEITGIKPVTLRAWQRRYNLIQPQRTDKGHRLYTQADVELIEEIQGWLNKGVSIGKVASLVFHEISEDDLREGKDPDFLDEYDDVLEALNQLKQSKLTQLMNVVMKEYPLSIVIARLIHPVLDTLDKMKSSARSLSRGLFQSVLISKLSIIMDAESRVKHKKRCLFVSLDPAGSLYAWLEAALVVESGKQLTFLDGVEDISGLCQPSLIESYDGVMIFANKALNDAQLQYLQMLVDSFDGSVEFSDVIRKLYGKESREGKEDKEEDKESKGYKESRL